MGSLIPAKMQSVLDRPKHWMSSTNMPSKSNIPPIKGKNNRNQILCKAVWTNPGNDISHHNFLFSRISNSPLYWDA